MNEVAKNEPKRATFSGELEAMSKCYEVLRELPRESQCQVLEWIGDRLQREQFA